MTGEGRDDPVDRVEASLAAVDWSSLHGGRPGDDEGSMAGIPRAVRDLWHEDLGRRLEALDVVTAAGFEFLSLHDVTVRLIPVLRAVLTDPRSQRPTVYDAWDPRLPLRARLLELLGTAAHAAALGGDDDELRAKDAAVASGAGARMSLADRIAGAEAPLRLAVRALAGPTVADIVPWLGDGHQRIALAAVSALTQWGRSAVPPARESVVRALMSVAARPDGAAALSGSAAYGLALLAEDTSVLLTHPVPAVRSCAALSPALAGDGRSVAVLEEALRYTPENDRWLHPASYPPEAVRLHIAFAETAAQRASGFDELVPGAFVVAGADAESTEAAWGPLLRVAFPPGWRKRALGADQREFLRRLVGNDDVWGERAAAARPYLTEAGLPGDRPGCRALLLDSESP